MQTENGKAAFVERSQRTPVSDAEETIRTLATYWAEWFPDQAGNFFDEKFPEMLRRQSEDETGDAVAAYWPDLMSDDPKWNELYVDMVYAGLISSAYCADAIRASESGSINAAWAFAGDARYWLGVARGQWGQLKSGRIVSDMARKGAEARHEETRKLKAEVQDYWRDNIGLDVSNEKAAEALLRVYPLAFRTLRDYVAEAKREAKQSAGKA